MNNKTQVKFRIFEDGDVIALFINEVWDSKGNISSYQRIGQHGAASPELVDDLKRATPKEYGLLLKELETIGYDDLEVL